MSCNHYTAKDVAVTDPSPNEGRTSEQKSNRVYISINTNCAVCALKRTMRFLLIDFVTISTFLASLCSHMVLLVILITSRISLLPDRPPPCWKTTQNISCPLRGETLLILVCCFPKNKLIWKTITTNKIKMEEWLGKQKKLV